MHQRQSSNTNRTVLVINVPFALLLELERPRKAMHEAGAFDDLQNTVGILQYVKRLSFFESEALSSIVNLLFDIFVEFKIDSVTATHVLL